jgi:uncharacterized protein (UPF0332 family)
LDKRIKPQKADLKTVARYLQQADKKLQSARKALTVDEETAYHLAYEAMLKASLGLMPSCGSRPRSQPGHHAVIIEFVQNQLGEDHRPVCMLFDRMRRKRNVCLYDVTGFISSQEASDSIGTAATLLTAIRTTIEKDNPQLKLFFPGDT